MEPTTEPTTEPTGEPTTEQPTTEAVVMEPTATEIDYLMQITTNTYMIWQMLVVIAVIMILKTFVRRS